MDSSAVCGLRREVALGWVKEDSVLDMLSLKFSSGHVKFDIQMGPSNRQLV